MLKLLAACFMLLDHISFTFLPYYTTLGLLLRCIGRLAMPIFAYKIAIGFNYTSNLSKYLSRLLLMACFAQIPYSCILYGLSPMQLLTIDNFYLLFTRFNIGFTFIFSLLILHRITSTSQTSTLTLLFNSLYIMVMLLLSIFSDYNIYGTFTVLLFYFSFKNNYSFKYQALLLTLLTLFFYNPYTIPNTHFSSYIQFLCIPSILLIAKIKDTRIKYLPKHFFYYFYPVHLWLLVILTSYIH